MLKLGLKLGLSNRKGAAGVSVPFNKQLKRVCLYYGHPAEINGSTTPALAANVYGNNFDILIFGDGNQDPAYDEYVPTKNTIAATKVINPSIEVFGYIPIGSVVGSTYSNLSMATLKLRVDQWIVSGATGIFLDEYGFDYYVTRERQNEIVSYCHSKGLNIIANAWTMDNVWSSGSGYVSWNDYYGNPNLLAPVVNSNDYYLFEEMFFMHDSTIGQQTSTIQRVYDAVSYYQDTHAEYGGKTYYEQFGTKTIALDMIQHDHPERQYMFNRAYLASLLLNIDGYAPSVENWDAGPTFPVYTQNYGITRPFIVPVTVGSYDGTERVYYDGDVGTHHVQLVWKPDVTTPDSYTAGYHLAYLDGTLVTEGSTSQPVELPVIVPPPPTNLAKTGLISYWNSKQGVSGATWSDLSGGGKHLTLSGDYALQPEGMYFGGTTGKAQSADNAIGTYADYTLEFGLRTTNLAATAYLMACFSASPTHGISISSAEILRIYDGTGSRVSTYTLPVGVDVVITLKRLTDTTHRLYVNGVAHSTITTVSAVGGFFGTILLASDDSSHFKGHISFARIYNRALTDAEITQNYSVGTNVW